MNAMAWFWIAMGALGLSAVFSTLHLSLRAASRVVLDELIEHAPATARARRLGAIIEHPDEHAQSVALIRLACSLVVVIALVRWLAAMSGTDTAGLAQITGGVVLATVLLWLVAIVVPMAIARHAGAKTVAFWSWLIAATHTVLRPLLGVARFFDEVVRRLAGTSEADASETLDAELLNAVDLSERTGHIDETARDMIEAVVEFRSTTVEEIMTPRTEINALEYTDDLATVRRFVREVGHSRIPVYRDNLDHIEGILYAKDLLHWMAQDEPGDFSLVAILRPATYIPETKTVRELLAELIAQRVHIAIAADEYGGTAGLVTIEDMVEEIFGEIEDEYEQDDDDRPSVDIDPQQAAAQIDARKHIDDANDAIAAIGIELPESDDYDTVGGFVATTMGRIPAVGETLTLDGLVVTVLEAEQTRVLRIRVQRVDHGAPVVPAGEPTHADPPTEDTARSA